MNKIKPIIFPEFKALFRTAQKNHIFNHEPIPRMFSYHETNVKSCLEVPFQTFGGKHLYKGFNSKAAILFYVLLKNHPLQNGNKRMAIISLGYFCEINNKKLKLTDNQLYALAKRAVLFTNKDKGFIYIRRAIQSAVK